MNSTRLFWPIPTTLFPSSNTPRPAGAVAWYRCGDRYGHRILLRAGGDWVEGAATLEDKEPSLWPSSPPIQQVGSQDVPATTRESSPALPAPVWFGLGMAGRSHWSVSIQPDETGVRFDWACRVGGTPAWLGITYVLPSEVRITGISSGLLLESTQHRWTLQVDADTTLLHRPSENTLQVVPKTVEATTCWRYAWRTANLSASTS